MSPAIPDLSYPYSTKGNQRIQENGNWFCLGQQEVQGFLYLHHTKYSTRRTQITGPGNKNRGQHATMNLKDTPQTAHECRKHPKSYHVHQRHHQISELSKPRHMPHWRPIQILRGDDEGMRQIQKLWASEWNGSAEKNPFGSMTISAPTTLTWTVQNGSSTESTQLETYATS